MKNYVFLSNISIIIYTPIDLSQSKRNYSRNIFYKTIKSFEQNDIL